MASAARPLSVLIETTPALTQTAGVGRYVRELVRALLRLDAPDLRLTGLLHADAHPAPTLPGSAAPRRLPLPQRRLRLNERAWRLLVLAAITGSVPWPRRALPNSGLFHGTNWLVPPLPDRATVVTVQDTTFLTHGAAHTTLNRFYLQLAAPLCARAANAVIVPSTATAADAVARLRVQPERVHIVPLGKAANLAPAGPVSVAELRARLGLPPRYLLFVSTIEPRKNLPALVTAFEQLAPDRPDLGLVIAGRTGWRAEGVLHQIDASAAAGRILRIGAVSDADLPALYTGAAALVAPSWYEGFGLTPLEAMACGAPVVVSDRGALPEVIGDAGLLIDPADPARLAAVLAQLLDTPALAATLGARGIERAARFTWERTARETLAIYRGTAGV